MFSIFISGNSQSKIRAVKSKNTAEEAVSKNKQVAILAVVKKDEVLILKRNKGSSYAGTWNLPGGSVEKGESLEIAAVRELREEANLIVNPDYLEYLGTLNRGGLELNFFITREFEGEVKINSESSEFKWVKIEDLESYPFVGGGKLNANIVKNIKDYVKGE